MRRDDQLPDFVGARCRVYGICASLLALAITLVMIFRSAFHVPAWLLVLFWTAYAVAVALLTAWLKGDGARAHSRFRRGEFPCWGCAYDPSQSIAERRCPECGREFDTETRHAAWADLRNAYQPGSD